MQPTAVEDAGRIERGLQAAMDREQRFGQRIERAGAIDLIAECDRVPTAAPRRFARTIVPDPALAAAPLDQGLAKIERCARRWHRAAPQRPVRGREERVRLLAQARPEAVGRGGLDARATERRTQLVDRRAGAST